MNQPLGHGLPARGRTKLIRILCVICGGLLAAVGLELFLMPHKLVLGGIAGLSALLAHLTEMRLGLFLFLFNLPFILLSRRQINLRFALYTLLGLFCLTIGSLALHHFPAVSADPLIAAVAGGLCLGLGIGIMIRSGGLSGNAREQGFLLTDGGPAKSAEVVIMLFNCGILLAGGLLFGWDQAMYSIIAYLLAFEGVRFSLRGLSRSRGVWITSSRCEDIRKALEHSLKRDAKLIRPGNKDGQPGVLFCLASKLEEDTLTSIVRSFDENSKITVTSNQPDSITDWVRRKIS
ncbi:YitT family protein [Paenibacillus typhae]|uniref:YitT family protein n=1 Tax=Paenibacillus typhae TaxID=1174501 RepID=UPI001C8ECD16|nr:YitT family protein [Paenibacillus typhae]MBY0011066.1 YitT family protein [Paenibacillus typhae]